MSQVLYMNKLHIFGETNSSKSVQKSDTSEPIDSKQEMTFFDYTKKLCFLQRNHWSDDWSSCLSSDWKDGTTNPEKFLRETFIFTNKEQTLMNSVTDWEPQFSETQLKLHPRRCSFGSSCFTGTLTSVPWCSQGKPDRLTGGKQENDRVYKELRLTQARDEG